MARLRGSSLGKIDVGDTTGSSISSAAVDNEIRERRALQGRALASSAAATSPTKPRVVKNKGTVFTRNAWVIPMAILVVFYSIYFRSTSTNPNGWWATWTTRCVKMSYHVPGTSFCGKGKYDWPFVAFHIVVFTWLREFCMQVALQPLAFILGLRTKHKVKRFVEQAYSMFYYGITAPVGLHIMKYRCPELWYFNTTNCYVDFPHREIDSWLKAFYLLQAAFWGQQTLVLLLHLEKRRRDFQELVFHHIITVALIWLSYRFHFMKMGLLVYITMDASDFFLALSKILNYLESPFVVPFFFTFVSMWIYLRHYLNIVLLYSVATEFRTVGPFDLNWVTQQYKCWISQYITFGLLLLLQLVNLYWLVLVLRIAYRYVAHNIKEDVRSEDEDDEEIVIE